jgi:hypothetical protein
MQKAILVKYLGPTNHKGSRWKASAQGGASVTLGRDYGLDGADDARRVADVLREKMQWRAIYGAGSLPNGDYVFTLGE